MSGSSRPRIQVSSLGSLGDVRQMLAVAVALQAQGAQVGFASSRRHRGLVEGLGVEFIEIGEDAYFDHQAGREALLDPVRGFDNFLRLANFDQFDLIFESLERAARDADLLVSTPYVMAAHLVAEVQAKPLVVGVLSPQAILKASQAAPTATGEDFDAWRNLLGARRSGLGLPRRMAPQFERLRAADLVLGLYPDFLAPDADRLAVEVEEVGFPLLIDPQPRLDPDLELWMDQGPFALVSFGSFVDRDTNRRCAVSAQACRTLGLRCLYLSPYFADALGPSDDALRIEAYAPHGQVIPKARLVVQHGGTGALYETLRAGVAAVISSSGGLDHGYNAQRAGALGLAQLIPAHAFNPPTLAAAMARALANPPSYRPPPPAQEAAAKRILDRYFPA